MVRRILVAGFGLLVLGLGAFGAVWTSVTPSAMRPQAPAFELIDLSGNPVLSAQLRGRTVLLNFWASYCPACRHEMPAIQALQAAHPEVVVIGINLGESPSAVAAFLDTVGVTFPVAIDRTGQVATAYQVTRLPATVVLDEDGGIMFEKLGSVELPELERNLQLKGASP